jgi:hypothetical protein
LLVTTSQPAHMVVMGCQPVGADHGKARQVCDLTNFHNKNDTFEFMMMNDIILVLPDILIIMVPWCQTSQSLALTCVPWAYGKGAHRLPNVSLGLAIPDPSTPCRQAILKTVLQLFRGSPTCRVGGLRLFSTPLDTPRRTPMCIAHTTPHARAHAASEDVLSTRRSTWFSPGSLEVWTPQKVTFLLHQNKQQSSFSVLVEKLLFLTFISLTHFFLSFRFFCFCSYLGFQIQSQN